MKGYFGLSYDSIEVLDRRHVGIPPPNMKIIRDNNSRSFTFPDYTKLLALFARALNPNANATWVKGIYPVRCVQPR